ncbi:MAG: DUF402 domain-containing protein [Candidatus Methanomethylicia archaeon]
MKVRVRGIYSTALSKLLIDEGYSIVQPSKVIKDRFNIGDEMDYMFYDVDILDRDDKHGVYILTSNENLRTIIDIIHRNLFDAIIRIAPYDVNGIYKGVVEAIDKVRNLAFISIMPKLLGVLPLSRDSPLKVGDEILVQVDKSSLGLRIPRLTTRIGLAGRYVVLFKGDGLKFSRKLTGSFIDYMNISETLKGVLPETFGVIIRSSFKSASKDDILNEISNLLDNYNRLMDLFRVSPSRRLIVNGLKVLDVEFPYNSKRILDSIRSFVTSTINFHHYFKILGENYSKMVDNVESLLSKGLNVDDTLLNIDLLRGEFASNLRVIEHVKLNGKVILFRNIESIDFNGKFLTIYRRVKSPGFYDGLNIVKMVGDKIVTKIGFGDWYYVSRYYSSDGQFLGSYININTPIEIYGDRLRYVDLEVDVCVKSNGEFKILDMDHLYKAFKMGVVSESLFRFISKLVDNIKSKIIHGEFDDI